MESLLCIGSISMPKTDCIYLFLLVINGSIDKLMQNFWRNPSYV